MDFVFVLAIGAVVTSGMHQAEATASSTTSTATLWTSDNCRDGNVTDLVCCRDDHCRKVTDKDACDKEKTCLWTKGTEDEYTCKTNRDADNNVCCLSKVSDYCSTIIDGKCPEHFQVPAGCCSEKGMTYTSVLFVEKPGYVCCNTPCKEAKNLNCSVPKQCLKPQGRTLGGEYGGGVDFGFNKYLLPPSQQPYGSVIPYTGFENRYDHLRTEEQSSVGDVNEITVDDLMSSLVEALSNDKDVYQYSSSTYSDPYLGKQKFGGLLGSFNYPDPKVFLNSIYGSPYGLSQGQFGLGGQGFPQVPGIFPTYGYGGSYGGGYGNGGGGYGNPGYGNSGYGGGSSSTYGNPGYGNSGYGGGSSTYGNSGYGNTGYGGGSSSYGNNAGYGNTGYGGGSSTYGNAGYGPSGYGNNAAYSTSGYGTSGGASGY